MMVTPVDIPKLENTVEECLITKWTKREDGPVFAGEPVVEVETDKATFEATAPVAGTVLATFFDDGTIVPVFTDLFVIGEPGRELRCVSPSVAHSRGRTWAQSATWDP